MRLLLLADTFPPRRTSGAVLLRDLAAEMARQGIDITVVVPVEELSALEQLTVESGVRVLRVKSARMKDVGYLRRTLAELRMSATLGRGMKRAGIPLSGWDGVVWYSPSIFLGPLAWRVRNESHCPGYLILRDIFPEWAVDMGLMGRGVAYRFFKRFETLQYRTASIIGIQTPANQAYFERDYPALPARVELLENWLGPPSAGTVPADLAPVLAGEGLRFAYTGNMGVAQGLNVVLAAIEQLRERQDLHFLFIGRGSEKARLQAQAQQAGLTRVHFHDDIDPGDLHAVLQHCHVGLVALDVRHQTHNVPGKFLGYLQAGLPVVAKVNPGNDLVEIIEQNQIGAVTTADDVEALVAAITSVADATGSQRQAMSARTRAVMAQRYGVETAVARILTALNGVASGTAGPESG